ncbi:hypothetical protein CONLIGDRAFT_227134 [Coniochaeta ligniaria NRRL 30616]|uniref:Uncharacterized protein n=1 Tax=Coniochaeta ligniaria NRRL 30616 TaxID=1408157 RepID=A0A1J7JQ70_9PEZI|nr:hypothetical protein CONLIGDRAFT_227134 [Coniochaeta ligniaria NRRL 30616]
MSRQNLELAFRTVPTKPTTKAVSPLRSTGTYSSSHGAIQRPQSPHHIHHREVKHFCACCSLPVGRGQVRTTSAAEHGRGHAARPSPSSDAGLHGHPVEPGYVAHLHTQDEVLHPPGPLPLALAMGLTRASRASAQLAVLSCYGWSSGTTRSRHPSCIRTTYRKVLSTVPRWRGVYVPFWKARLDPLGEGMC